MVAEMHTPFKMYSDWTESRVQLQNDTEGTGYKQVHFIEEGDNYESQETW